MQGSVLASWDHKHDVGRMDMIKRVVLKTSSGSYIIGKTIFHNQKAQLKPSRCFYC